MPEITSTQSGPISPGSGNGPRLADVARSSEGERESSSAQEQGTPFDDEQPDVQSKDSKVDAENDSGPESGSQKPQSHAQKRETKFARAKRQRAEFQARVAAFEQQKAQWEAQQRQAEEAKKPKFDLNELKEFRKQWMAEGNEELVEKADAKIAELEEEQRQKSAVSNRETVWRQAEAELSRNDPDFLKAGTRLDTRLREIMAGPDGNIYRSHERGIVAAYHRAKMELLQEDHQALQKQHKELKEEYQRATGLTSIGGGSQPRMGNGAMSPKEFSRLPTAEMRKRLASKASTTPWI
jgi:hypothetical protein